MLAFDNRFTTELPADTITENVRHQVQGALFSRVQPTPVAAPYLVAYAQEVAADLGLDETQMQSPEMLTVLAGNSLLTGMDPHATCYGGHQFGNWA
ncbi:MAG: protein adenylyltransferase SelO family protein, partial [Pseudomonadota bacterium]